MNYCRKINRCFSVIFLWFMVINSYSQSLSQTNVPYIEFKLGGFVVGFNSRMDTLLNPEIFNTRRAEVLCTRYFHERINNDRLLDSVLNTETVLTESEYSGKIIYPKPTIYIGTRRIVNTENTIVIKFLKEICDYYSANGGQGDVGIQIMSIDKPIFDSINTRRNFEMYLAEKISKIHKNIDFDYPSVDNSKELKIMQNTDIWSYGDAFSIINGKIESVQSIFDNENITKYDQGRLKVVCLRKEDFDLFLCQQEYKNVIDLNKLDCITVKDSADIDTFIEEIYK